MGSSEIGFKAKISDFFRNKIFYACKSSLSFLSNFIIFFTRLIYALIANLLTMAVVFSIAAFGIVIVVAFCLLIIDFFLSNNTDGSNGSEFISTVSENLFSLLSTIFDNIGKLLDYVSSNYICQGIAFFLIFIVLTNKLVNAGINGFIDKAKIWFARSKSRFVWAFEPTGFFQPKREQEENE